MANKPSLNKPSEKSYTLIAFAIIGFVLAYSLFVRAVDTGSLFQYALVIVFAGLSVVMIYKSRHLHKYDRKK